MNERVREFMAKAGTDTSGKWMGVDNAEKFAELIVRECSKVNNQYVGWRIGDIDLDMVYKEHFGVEE